MKNSVILLALALLLLYLAVTDKLSRLLDAWDVIRGKRQAQVTPTSNGGSALQTGRTALSLPSLPPLGTLGNVTGLSA